MKSYSEDSTNLTLQGNHNHFQLSTCIFLPIKLKVVNIALDGAWVSGVLLGCTANKPKPRAANRNG